MGFSIPDEMKTIILDPGHGMSNRRSGRYDPGATNGDYTEAEIVMDWANVLREVLMSRGYRVIRTRVDAKDPAAISQRANIARKYEGEIMLSLHCNAANGLASGTETFYRGAENKEMAQRITDAVASVLGTKNRGAKTLVRRPETKPPVTDSAIPSVSPRSRIM